MIIPTPDFDPLYADDGVPFRAKMLDVIRREFADLLGPHAKLLKLPNGLDVLAETYGTANEEQRRAA
jgi:hypothetical protein